jgi:hypothetical protein
VITHTPGRGRGDRTQFRTVGMVNRKTTTFEPQSGYIFVFLQKINKKFWEKLIAYFPLNVI